MASRLELRRFRDVLSFLIGAMRVRKQMLGSPGSLGVSLVAKPLRRTFWTVSAWRDGESLRKAVNQQPHLDTMNRFRPRMAASSFVTWSVEPTALPVPWSEAMRRLEKPDTVSNHP